MRRSESAGRWVVATVVALVLGAMNAWPGAQSQNSAARVLRLATTTSTSDSGLLQAILPP